MNVKKSKSSILIYTLLFISILLVLLEQFVLNTNLYSYFSVNAIDTQKARVLAIGGINLARVQLSMNEYEKKDEDKSTQKNAKPDPNKKGKEFLKNILPNLNRWQEFKLDEKIDGFDGKVKFCISCENGKININEVFDFKKQSFKPEMKPFFDGLSFGEKEAKGSAFARNLEKFFKERKKKLDDLSQLLDIEGISSLQFLYNPPMYDPPKGAEEAKRKNALMDIFTIYTKENKIEPWLFSDSLCGLLGFRRPQWNDSVKMKDIFEKSIEKFKLDLGKNWKDNWDVLRPIYEKRFDSLRVIEKILSPQFAPSVYTVISCGIVGRVEQKILAVLSVEKNAKNKVKSKANDKKKKSDSEKEIQPVPAEFVKILKIYWL